MLFNYLCDVLSNKSSCANSGVLIRAEIPRSEIITKDAHIRLCQPAWCLICFNQIQIQMAGIRNSDSAIIRAYFERRGQARDCAAPTLSFPICLLRLPDGQNKNAWHQGLRKDSKRRGGTHQSTNLWKVLIIFQKALKMNILSSLKWGGHVSSSYNDCQAPAKACNLEETGNTLLHSEDFPP